MVTGCIPAPVKVIDCSALEALSLRSHVYFTVVAALVYIFAVKVKVWSSQLCVVPLGETDVSMLTTDGARVGVGVGVFVGADVGFIVAVGVGFVVGVGVSEGVGDNSSVGSGVARGETSVGSGIGVV